MADLRVVNVIEGAWSTIIDGISYLFFSIG
jgi:hypothetical protein